MLMKKIIASFILFSLISSSFAQDQFYFGLKSGIGFSFEQRYINGDKVQLSQYEVLQYDFNGGLELNILLGDNLSLESEAIFEDKGYRGYVTPALYSPYIQNINVDYLQIPVLLRYTLNFEDNNKFMPFVELGFYFADRLYVRDVDNNSVTYLTSSYNGSFYRIDKGITGGIGVIKKIGRGYSSFNVRLDNSVFNNYLNPSITVLNAQTNNFFTVNQSFIFRVLSFCVNYTYPLKLDKTINKYN
jgi:hypothetical protein